MTQITAFDKGTIQITVDGHERSVPAGLTVFDALSTLGIRIPALCHDVRLARSNGNCGLCMVELGTERRPIKACITPASEGMVITTTSDAIGHFRRVRMEQLLADHNADCLPPCQKTCPAGIDVQRYLANVADGNITAAIRVIKDHNPFPSVCGRVCPHPCEMACRRNLVDEAVAINAVKRFAAEADLSSGAPWLPKVKEATGKTIAIVGAGPSGLSAAYYLVQEGHQVTVFDRQPKPGGMLRYGIPEYRLPKADLDAEIATIQKLGVRIQLNRALGTHMSLEDLRRDFDAVYLAIGSWMATRMHVDGEACSGVWRGINFLEQVTKGTVPEVGDTVLVVGGGNTAIDAARTARRLGAQVELVYRRTRTEMPAEAHEVEDAIAEGVKMTFLASPTRITRDNNRLTMNCLRMELGEPDRSGRRRPIAIEGSDFALSASLIIGAIGQSTDTQFLYNDLPLRRSQWGDIEADATTAETSEEGIFAGGDCVTGPATVIAAIAAGRRAAGSIHQYVSKGYVRSEPEIYDCSRGENKDLVNGGYAGIPTKPRLQPTTLAVDQRLLDGTAEVTQVFDPASARAEASRCLKCGCLARFHCDLRNEATHERVSYRPPLHKRPYQPIQRDHPFIIRDHNKCISCGRCVAACAEIEGPGVLAYQFHNGQLKVGTSDGRPLIETDCVSCGQCVASCPCGALDYRRERPAVFKALNDPKKLVVGFLAPAPRSVICSAYNIPYSEAGGFTSGLMRELGFDKVFDFTFAADLTIVEETTEFLNRLSSGGVMPQFTSCCPGWVNMVEKRFPALIPHLSTCKSPQQMMGATVKNHFAKVYNVDLNELYVVSIVPCLAKKYEAARPEFAPGGIRDVDAVITTSEFFEMIRRLRIDPTQVQPSTFDDPYRRVTGAGILFGAAGGVAEAAMRMAAEQLTGEAFTDQLVYRDVPGQTGIKETSLTVGERTIRVAAISGLGNAEPLAQRIVAGEDVGYDLIEVMACPGGCIAGAGNPIPQLADELSQRQEVLISIDETSTYRKSQDNPDILRLYEGFYGEPNSPLAHQLLHTSYHPFDRSQSV
ncbi:MAG: [FeFe] hydrogenase, group A [Propionibacteriaceae bacterium]|jgi:formate dehydrogenase major subunit|nr:[FeFe] hydrogenase, group A [Propionibacteriaceae bacterium]